MAGVGVVPADNQKVLDSVLKVKQFMYIVKIRLNNNYGFLSCLLDYLIARQLGFARETQTLTKAQIIVCSRRTHEVY